MGTGRGANRAKSSKSRSLRIESLEDRALLSVTTGALDPSVFNGENNGALEAAAIPTDAAIPLSGEAASEAADQTISAVVPNTTPLDAPTGVKLDYYKGFDVRVSWDPVEHAAGYMVYYTSSAAIDPEGGKVWVESGQNTAEFTCKQLATYVIVVQACGDGETYDNSEYSGEVLVSVPALEAPTGLQAEDFGDGQTACVCWDGVGEATGYTLRISDDGGATWGKQISFGKTLKQDINLGPGTFLIQVRADNNVLGGPSNSMWSTSAEVKIKNTKLDTPIITSAIATATQGNEAAITVSWTNVDDAAGYALQYKKVSEGQESWVTINLEGPSETSCVIEGLERDTAYHIRVRAVAAKGSDIDDSGYCTEKTVITPLSDWYLMDYADYTNFRVDATAKMAYLYGVSKDGQESVVLKTVDIAKMKAVSITIRSDSTARNVEITDGALTYLGEIVYVGGKNKNDTLRLVGSKVLDTFRMSQETLIADVYDRVGKAAQTQEVVFETVSTWLGHKNPTAVVKMSGIRSVALETNGSEDTFEFTKFGTTYDIVGEYADLNFASATSGVKLDLGKTSAQSALAGQKGKLILHGNVTSIEGSRFNDTITTTANTRWVRGNGGSDTVKLIGGGDKGVQVMLQGGAQKVTGKGTGSFTVTIAVDRQFGIDGTGSTVNMSSVKNGRLELIATGNKIKVTGTKGDDMLNLIGSNIDVQGNDGNDIITVIGANAKVRGGKGDDIVDLTEAYGKCVIDGGDGDDILIGSDEGSDTIKGGSGNNILIGLGGADKLTGGRGRDILIANQTIGMMEGTTELAKVLELLKAGDMEGVIAQLGTVSMADGEKDVLKRGGGEGKLFYANIGEEIRGNDFDTTDCKLDKGDLLYIGLTEELLGEAEGKRQEGSARKEEAKDDVMTEEKRQAESARKDESKADAKVAEKVDAKADKLRDAAKAQER